MPLDVETLENFPYPPHLVNDGHNVTQCCKVIPLMSHLGVQHRSWSGFLWKDGAPGTPSSSLLVTPLAQVYKFGWPTDEVVSPRLGLVDGPPQAHHLHQPPFSLPSTLLTTSSSCCLFLPQRWRGAEGCRQEVWPRASPGRLERADKRWPRASLDHWFCLPHTSRSTSTPCIHFSTILLRPTLENFLRVGEVHAWPLRPSAGGGSGHRCESWWRMAFCCFIPLPMSTPAWTPTTK